MDYTKTVEKIDSYVLDNFDILEFLYLRDGDCKYSSLINNILKGKTLVELKSEIGLFYRFQGMDKDARINLLKLFDDEKEIIRSIDYKNIDNVYIFYCDLLKKTGKITGKLQFVNTAKILNLYNQNIPLFDNNVINFLNYLNRNEKKIEKRLEENYKHILNLYKIINEKTHVSNIIKLYEKVFIEIRIKHINLNKFIDTLMYFINDTKKISEYKKLCMKKGQTST